ncbi:hypothetical protein ABZ946_21955 [Streptomyces sp. NPDC046324]|uniref:hypothetical protein n=1 Tax=Streptomyces sp. NPDC046324 TaxID=3154915 RepID=UPI00340DCA5D
MARSRYEADQIVFRWDSENAVGSTGFGPVAWSGPREEVETLFQIYGTLLRANGEETRPALLRVEQRAGVVLIRRTPLREAGVRESVVCHALVGSPELLDPAFCLGLHAWDWEGAELPSAQVRGALPVVPRDVLAASAVTGQRTLDLGLPAVERELAGAVAELLRHPLARFTLLDERGDTACPVLRGLHGMFGAVPRPRRWTFASHDTAELTSLRFVFVSRWAGAASRNTERRRVDPLERVGDRAEELAERLVRHHLRGGPEGLVAAALREVPGAGDLPLLETAERALNRLDGTATATRARRSGGREPEADAKSPGYGEAPGYGGAEAPGYSEAPGYAEAPGHSDSWDPCPSAREVRGVSGREPREASHPYRPSERPPATGTSGLYRDDPAAPPMPAEDPVREVPSPLYREAPDRPPTATRLESGTTSARESGGTASLYRAESDWPPTVPREAPDRPPTVPREAPDRPPAPPHEAPAPPAPSGLPDPAPAPVAVVPPVWRGPEDGKGWWRAVRSWRRRGKAVETELVRWLADGTADAPARIRAGGDAELLAALRGRHPYPTTTLLMHEVARRLPGWPPPLRREFRDLVLAGELFVTAPGPALPGEPTEAERAANAAALHRWAVRPLLDEKDAPAPGVLLALLSRLRTSDAPAARAAYRQIVEGERPGLPEEVWQALLHEADTAPPPPRPTAPPAPAAPPATAAPAAPATVHPPAPAHPAPAHPAPVPPPEPTGGDGRLVALTLFAVFVTLLALIVAYTVT